VPLWTADELGRFLIAPDAAEQLSPVSGAGVVLLDLAASGPDSIERWSVSLLAELPILPAVTIALVDPDAQSSVGRAIEACCDVVLVDEAEIEPLLDGFRRTPQSALAFVQLLRSSSPTSIHAALLAESFVYSTLQAGAEFAAWLAGRKKRRGLGRARRREPAVESERACRFERHEGRLEITLTRPDKHNAFSKAMRDGLSEGLQLALADPSIDDVVLRGEGDSFCSGGDLDEFGSFPDSASAHVIRTTRSPALLLSRLADRVRCELHGACIGAGAELPAFTRRVVASEDTFFQLPEVGLGLVPGAGGTASLPRRIGRQRTAWLGLSGARIDAPTALEWGLVDELRLGQHVAGRD
jgi:enoyl-CoA hydratase/carnithine racemase